MSEGLPGFRFVVVGAGGLGCPLLLGLVAAGARSISLIDADEVALSNLHRQVLFDVGDIGAAKVSAAEYQLRRRAPELVFDGHCAHADKELLTQLVRPHAARTVVLEGSDSPRTKFMVNDLCMELGVPAVIGGAARWEGHVMAIGPGSACLRCVFPEPPPPELAPNCQATGVVGTAPGLIGSLMAAQAIAFTRQGPCQIPLSPGNPGTPQDESPAGRLIAVDLRQTRVQHLHPHQSATCPCHSTSARATASRRQHHGQSTNPHSLA